MNKLINIDSSWNDFFNNLKSDEKINELFTKINKAYKEDIYYPEYNDIFKAFKLTSLNKCNIIWFGQDPYHQIGKATGLAFSINPGAKISCSLRNIFKELYDDLSIKRTNTDLSDWATQGILLLNTVLTVKQNTPLSCEKWGWNHFIVKFLNYIHEINRPFIFILLGNKAKELKQYINLKKDYIIESSHPSGLSYNKGFKGSKIFTKINNILFKLNYKKINW